MKIAYLGHADFGAKCLECVLDSGIEVSVCITHTAVCDPHTGRRFPRIEPICIARGIPYYVLDPNQVADVRKVLTDVRPDLIVLVTWRGLLPADIVSLAPKGAINLHGSLLPKYRGNAPVTWALINGETEIGASVHYVDEGMDTGDVLGHVKISVGRHDSVGDVLAGLLVEDGPLLVKVIRQISEGTAVARAQDSAGATTGRKRLPEDGIINWSADALAIHNFIRAQSRPLPGAFTTLGHEKLFVWKASYLESDNPAQAQPGIICEFIEADGQVFPVVFSGKGKIVLMDASRGYSQNNELEELIKTGVLATGVRFL